MMIRAVIIDMKYYMHFRDILIQMQASRVHFMRRPFGFRYIVAHFWFQLPRNIEMDRMYIDFENRHFDDRLCTTSPPHCFSRLSITHGDSARLHLIASHQRWSFTLATLLAAAISALDLAILDDIHLSLDGPLKMKWWSILYRKLILCSHYLYDGISHDSC